MKKCKYGLIGEKLGHSFSKILHNEFDNYEYDILEIPRDEVDEFFKKADFLAINVTIPYKETAMKYCIVDETAKAIGAVNTVVNRQGRLYGYNTDYLGFEYMVRSAGIAFDDKDIVILGSGGTSKTACFASQRLGARSVTIVSREKREYDTSVTIPVKFTTYADEDSYKNAQILINTTPVGMSPNNEAEPIDIEVFESLEGVVDVIYNPLMTRLVSKARDKGIKAVNGLPMLVAQGWYAERLFFDLSTDMGKAEKESVDTVYRKILGMKQNIVFVGMPGCGKSTQGKILSKELGRDLIDTDSVFLEKYGIKAGDYITQYSEEEFRIKESEVIKEVCRNNGVIIATGGGSILRSENREAMKSNGYIIYLSQDPEKLSQRGRPLSQNGGIKKLYEVRKPIYESIADTKIEVSDSIEETAKKIRGLIHENFGN